VDDAMAKPHDPMPRDLRMLVFEFLGQAIGSFTDHRQVPDNCVDGDVIIQERRVVHAHQSALDPADAFEDIGDEKSCRPTRHR
jgi:hypothetical protein